jgi:response regulator RpfG family c-di-GMP phosphodiesterase
MAIPEAILGKRGTLSQQEWELMRQHTIAGERIVRSSAALADVAPLVRASHERWDGAGYPDRLAGEEIPLGARIIAVCDSYHAMTSDRSYRSAMSHDVALAELRAGAARQFDPEVVRAFLAEGRCCSRHRRRCRAPPVTTVRCRDRPDVDVPVSPACSEPAPRPAGRVAVGVHRQQQDP